jgi:hypothetical protein
MKVMRRETRTLPGRHPIDLAVHEADGIPAGLRYWQETVPPVPRRPVVIKGGPNEADRTVMVTDRPSYSVAWVADEAEQFSQFDRLYQNPTDAPVDLVPRTPEDEEAELLARQFPRLAARLKVAPAPRVVPPGWLFDAGMVTVTKLARKTAPVDVIYGFLGRHLAGDHGNLGGPVVLSADQKFCPHLFGRAVANSAAIAEGFGLLKSEYSGTWDPSRGEEHVTIVTRLWPRSAPATVVYSSRDQNQF